MNATKLNFRLDVVLGIVFTLTLLSGLTAQPIHGRMEFHIFAGLSLSAGIVTHLVLHRKWIAATSRSGQRSGQMRLSIWLNRLLGISWLLTVLSGPYDHLNPHSGVPVHVLAAASMTIILAVHLVRHWKWVMVTMGRYGMKL